MHRFRRSCVRVRESTLLVALSRTGLARGRLLLDRHPAEGDRRQLGFGLQSGRNSPISIRGRAEGLPGIGEPTRRRFIENRPYARKDELVKKKLIPQATYDKIKNDIIAKQVKK